jgi:hypothetical protein
MRMTRCCALRWNATSRSSARLSARRSGVPQTADRITDEQRIIAFRNRLIHVYATVSHALVWDIVQTNLLRLRDEVAALLSEAAEEKG